MRKVRKFLEMSIAWHWFLIIVVPLPEGKPFGACAVDLHKAIRPAAP